MTHRKGSMPTPDREVMDESIAMCPIKYPLPTVHRERDRSLQREWDRERTPFFAGNQASTGIKSVPITLE